MKPHRLIAVFLGLTTGLLGIIAYLAYLLLASSTTTVSGDAARALASENRSTNQKSNLKVVTVPRVLPLDWRSIESTNYKTYVANLRSIGCPEDTIRDIVTADINNEYAQRRERILPPPDRGKYWLLQESEQSVDPAVQKQLRALDDEKNALVKQLLGIDIQKEQLHDPSFQRTFGFLSQEKQQRIRELQARFEEREHEVLRNAHNFMTPEDEEALSKLRQEQAAEIEKQLAPEELEQYELRNSDTANQLRASFVGFEPTEEEFKAMFKLRKAFDEKFGGSSADDASTSRQKEAAEKDLNDQLKKILGDDRFADYQHAQDSDYQNLYRLADRYELPKETILKAYDMKRTVENQATKIQLDLKLSEVQRDRALAALRRETDRALAATLGEKAFKAYRETAGQWLDDYSTPVEIEGLHEAAQTSQSE